MLNEEQIGQILDNGLGDVGAISGAIAVALGPRPGIVSAAVGAMSAQAGAKFASRLLPTDHENESIQINNPERFQELFKQYMNNYMIYEANDNNTYYAIGVKGSGALNMNPCVLEVTLNQNNLSILAHAKEGLIKQKTCLKAIEQLKAYLEQNQ